MGELAKLPNIGSTVEEQLNKVGIYSYEALKEVGSKAAWLKIKEIDESACINRLYALEGAIEGIRKTALAEEKKQELKDFYNTHK
nr:TfoX/Sxy family protein [uncultured Cellulosilyticum sp.]